MLVSRPSKTVSILGIDLGASIRVKLYSQLVSGTLVKVENGTSEVLLVIEVELSFSQFSCSLYIFAIAFVKAISNSSGIVHPDTFVIDYFIASAYITLATFDTRYY